MAAEQLENVTTQSTTDSNNLHCGHGDLMGSLGLLVQALLAFIAFSALVVKRFCEPAEERRSWGTWFFDTSKQAIGAAVIHFANVFLSELFQGDPCTWYIISFLLDSTIGLFIICVCLKISLLIIKKMGWKSLIFGQYDHPARCKAWMSQCIVYITIIVFEKILMTVLVLFDFWKQVRRFILSPITNPNLELIIVMFIVPFIVNALIFWVVDNFLKEKPRSVRKISDVSGIVKHNSTFTDFAKKETGSKHVRLSPFNRSGYGRVRSTNDSDSERLLSFDDDPGFDTESMQDRPPQLAHNV